MFTYGTELFRNYSHGSKPIDAEPAAQALSLYSLYGPVQQKYLHTKIVLTNGSQSGVTSASPHLTIKSPWTKLLHSFDWSAELNGWL